jgi:hypothetical protein
VVSLAHIFQRSLGPVPRRNTASLTCPAVCRVRGGVYVQAASALRRTAFWHPCSDPSTAAWQQWLQQCCHVSRSSLWVVGCKPLASAQQRRWLGTGTQHWSLSREHLGAHRVLAAVDVYCQLRGPDRRVCRGSEDVPRANACSLAVCNSTALTSQCAWCDMQGPTRHPGRSVHTCSPPVSASA